MAAEPVTADQYPDLEAFELTSEQDPRVETFHGRLVAEAQPCPTCRDDLAIVYRGPQYGLAFDVPGAPVELEITWCTRHGFAGMRLVDQDGTEHAGL